MRRWLMLPLVVAILHFAAGCTNNIQVTGSLDADPEIYPDYKGVTIPVNIAPLNFEVLTEDDAKIALRVESESATHYVRASDGLISFDRNFWRSLLDDNRGRELVMTICIKETSGWKSCCPFTIMVAEEEVDPYLVYRLIPPGYSLWKEMGIYQRELLTYKESVIYRNTQGRGNCVNCHSFCDRDPQSMLFHMRSELAGTYVFRNGGKQKLDTKIDATISALVYPSWHPSGSYVAFSVNKTNQVLHVKDPNRIEVFDEASDVVVYDVDSKTIITYDKLSSESSFETFPTFSPDGRFLYFCTADEVGPMPESFKDVKYSLCRVEFNPENCSVGERVDTLYNAQLQGGSVSFPRISPDGNLLVFTLSGYGNFSIWHKDSDLYCLDLQSEELENMEMFNSEDVESYHSWSSNSRWVVFSSRRGDGLYTRPYIGYVDEEGNAHKPFLLPQADPRKYYDFQMFSYNIPEFVSGKVKVGGKEISAFAKQNEGEKVSHKNNCL